MRWTAFKITQFGHGMCSANGEPCDCETAEHTVAVSEERVEDQRDGFGTVPGGGRGAVAVGADADRDLAEAMPQNPQGVGAVGECCD